MKKVIKDFVDMMEKGELSLAFQVKITPEYRALKASISPVSEETEQPNPAILDTPTACGNTEQPTDTQDNDGWRYVDMSKDNIIPLDKSEGLIECPFCGKPPITRITFGVPLVECGNAKCLIAPSTWLRIQDTDVKAAIKEWNARTKSKQEAKLTAIVKELREALECTIRVAGLNGVPELVYMAQQALLRAEQIEIDK